MLLDQHPPCTQFVRKEAGDCCANMTMFQVPVQRVVVYVSMSTRKQAPALRFTMRTIQGYLMQTQGTLALLNLCGAR
jgi:hypothetical protein